MRGYSWETKGNPQYHKHRRQSTGRRWEATWLRVQHLHSQFLRDSSASRRFSCKRNNLYLISQPCFKAECGGGMPLIPAHQGWKQEARALWLLSPTQSVSPRSQRHKHLRDSIIDYSLSFTHVHTHVCMQTRKKDRVRERKEEMGKEGGAERRGTEAYGKKTWSSIWSYSGWVS